MIKPEYRLYHKNEQRMYHFVKSWEQSFGINPTVWTVWDHSENDRTVWPTKKFNDNDVIKMHFIGAHDDTKWHDLKDWEQDFWVNKGYTQGTWKGKPIFLADIIKRVTEGKKDKMEVVQINSAHLLCDKDNCIAEIPQNRQNCEIYVIGNTLQNMDLLEDGIWQPIKSRRGAKTKTAKESKEKTTEKVTAA